MAKDITLKIDKQLDVLKDQVKDNIKTEEKRGADLGNLEKRSSNLMKTSIAFKKQAEKTKYQMMWELYKWYMIAGILVLILLLPIIKIFI
ncbi:hypothetical protein VCUG_00114 [Vavraia culicis subsp. floridensis]|uniref:V-SNARE coiled-coil homology domain-containing protein n=1 Tax=Vavraia culicis (isolate floridensis) TaxID=948595 RepID=L2GZJ9_VAVCU|nr:uncharacterized protein VCUG_00114 [Vavraia culicis subsp. floridensis]ELA48505.1 hypothetical protein VCUG_00114 [Vavraia culicis subsp. floridensis]